MFLKNLTMFGFKSFADKTSLDFLPGITAIVGPNGCGKSNVADAIRWVLGEQSAKALRGGEMADVIFNGTDRRKPLGVAEVSMTLGDVDQERLKAAGVELEFNEISVGRRVYRDGGSEYLINQNPCRLRDIQQLFMGTGVGRTSYSIMAQGNITQILSSKPDDRRMVFEEAAGITRFKSQKKETLRKLEQTEQNLLRVADLVREIKRQLTALQRQVGKAKQYQEVMTRLKHLECQFAKRQWMEWVENIVRAEEGLALSREKVKALRGGIQEKEEEWQIHRGRQAESEQMILQAQRRVLEARNEHARQDQRIQHHQERLEEWAIQMERLDQEWQRAEVQLGEVTQIVDGYEAECEKVREEWIQREKAFSEHQRMVSALEEEIRVEESAWKGLKQSMIAIGQSLARARNDWGRLESDHHRQTIQGEKLTLEISEIRDTISRLDGQLQEAQEGVVHVRERLQVRESSLKDARGGLGELEKEHEALKRTRDEARKVWVDLDGELRLLERLAEDHQGFDQASALLLKSSDKVQGALADSIQVSDDYAVAVEAVLKHTLQAALTAYPEDAFELLDRLKGKAAGRGCVLALSLFPRTRNGNGKGDGLERWGRQDRISRWGVMADAVVEVHPRLAPWVGKILEGTCIVPDLTAALEAWREIPWTYDFVTYQGEILDRYGLFHGREEGSSEEGGASILRRKNQMQEVLLRKETAGEELARMEQSLAEVGERLRIKKEELTTLEQELSSVRMDLANGEGSFNALKQQRVALGKKLENLEFELEGLRFEGAEEQGMWDRLKAQIEEFGLQEKEAQARDREVQERIEELRERRESALEELTEVKLRLATQDQEKRASDGRRDQAALRLEELQTLLEDRERQRVDLESKQQKAQAEILQAEEKKAELEQLRIREEAESRRLLEDKQQLDETVRVWEQELIEAREKVNEVQSELSKHELKLTQNTLQRDALVEKIQQKYLLQLSDIELCHNIETRVDTVGETTIHILEEGIAAEEPDWAAVKIEVSVLQKKIDSLGPVNLVAIEEFEDTEKRYHFLEEQYQDLVQAKAQLLEILERINSQTQELFMATFEKIRENFKNLFSEIFGGGKADLVLLDEEDVLESGIEIKARPPGKQLQSISLLSGGEQTMTAVALLFAIYQVKPSPFCVLDELDAPLDESNINRFIKVLKRFVDHSQFIIITHHKRTISMADVLYGVTMEEFGVSKMVSVKFHMKEDVVA